MLLAGLLGPGLHLSKIILVVSQQTQKYSLMCVRHRLAPESSIPCLYTCSWGTGHLPALLTCTSLPGLRLLTLISHPPLSFPSPVTQGMALLRYAELIHRHCFQHPPLPGSPSISGTRFSRLRNSFFSASHVQSVPMACSFCYQYLPFYFFSFTLNPRLTTPHLSVFGNAFHPVSIPLISVSYFLHRAARSIRKNLPLACHITSGFHSRALTFYLFSLLHQPHKLLLHVVPLTWALSSS